MKYKDLIDDESNIPKAETHSCMLKLSMQPDFFEPISVPIMAVFVDVSCIIYLKEFFNSFLKEMPTIDLPPHMDFDLTFRQQKSKVELLFKNPARRPLQWHFYIEKMFADIFIAEGQTEARYFGY